MAEIDRTVGSLRKILLGILFLGMAGTSTELMLLKHNEDVTQLIPLILLGMGLAVVAWNVLRKSRASLLSMQLLMVLFVGAGALGMFFHYRANVDFQLEIEPALSGSNLLWKVLQAKTPPALAPGVMAQLGLIGLAYAFRHPAVVRTHSDIEENRYGE